MQKAQVWGAGCMGEWGEGKPDPGPPFLAQGPPSSVACAVVNLVKNLIGV